MKPMNVLYLVRTWAMGGSHTIILLLLKHLPRDRFNITVVPYDAHWGDDEKFAKTLAQRGHTVAPERIPWKSRFAWRKARQTLAQLIDQYEIDLIHTHDPHSNVLVGLGRKRWPCACVASPYGWWDRLFPLRSHAYVWMERHRALPQFDRQITVSQTMKAKILRGPSDPDRIRVIHTGLDRQAMSLAVPRETARAVVRMELGIPDDACVVGTVSRIYVEKGHKYLIEAVARLLPEVPHLYLLILGEGPLLPKLQDQAERLGISHRISFAGYYRDLPGALAAMDIFALPSILDEGFPTAVLEAQMAGLPVVATSLGGTHETMDVNRTGLLVPPKDAAALAEALALLARDRPHRKRMGEAARAWVTGSFTLEKMITDVGITYDEALAAYRARPPRR